MSPMSMPVVTRPSVPFRMWSKFDASAGGAAHELSYKVDKDLKVNVKAGSNTNPRGSVSPLRRGAANFQKNVNHGLLHEPVWRCIVACAGSAGGVAKAMQENEQKRIQSLWGAYLAERRLRGTKRGFRVTDQMHARILQRLQDARANIQENQAFCEAGLQRKEREQLLLRDMRGHLLALEGELRTVQEQRFQEEALQRDEKNEANRELTALRLRSSSLEQELRDQRQAVVR